MLRSVVFFYIKTPLRVKEAGLEELIPTTWWPTHFDKEVTTHSGLLRCFMPIQTQQISVGTSVIEIKTADFRDIDERF